MLHTKYIDEENVCKVQKPLAGTPFENQDKALEFIYLVTAKEK